MVSDCLDVLPSVKGHVMMQALDKYTGSVVNQMEVDNVIMDDSLNYWKFKQRGFWLSGNYNNGTRNGTYNTVPRMAGSHIILTTDSATPSSTNANLSGSVVGWASRWAVGSPSGKRGNVNPYLCSVSPSQSRWVFEWQPQNGNGTFQTVSWGIMSLNGEKYIAEAAKNKIVTIDPTIYIGQSQSITQSGGINYYGKYDSSDGKYKIYSINMSTGLGTLVFSTTNFPGYTYTGNVVPRPGGGWTAACYSAYNNQGVIAVTNGTSGGTVAPYYNGNVGAVYVATDGASTWAISTNGHFFSIGGTLTSPTATYLLSLGSSQGVSAVRGLSYDGTYLVVAVLSSVSNLLEIRRYTASSSPVLVSTISTQWSVDSTYESATAPDNGYNGTWTYTGVGASSLGNYFGTVTGNGYAGPWEYFPPTPYYVAPSDYSTGNYSYNSNTGNLMFLYGGAVYELPISNPQVVGTKALLPAPFTKTSDYTLRVTYDINFI